MNDMTALAEASIKDMLGNIPILNGTVYGKIAGVLLDKLFDKISTHIDEKRSAAKLASECQRVLSAYRSEPYYNELDKWLTDSNITDSAAEDFTHLYDGSTDINSRMSRVSAYLHENVPSMNENECKLFVTNLFGAIFQAVNPLPESDIPLANQTAMMTAQQTSVLQSKLQAIERTQQEIKDAISQLNTAQKVYLEHIRRERQNYIDLYVKTPLFLETGEAKARLCDVYVLPRAENVPDVLLHIHDFLADEIHDTLIIEGEAAVGKTSLTARFLHDKDVLGQAEEIIVVPMKNVAVSSFDGLLRTVGIQDESFLSGKILILEAYDEYPILTAAEADKILNSFRQTCHKYGCKLIVTTRKGYTDDVTGKKVDRIELLPFNGEQIREFTQKYNGITGKNAEIRISEENKTEEVLGIPFVLYSALATNLRVTEDMSIAEIYEIIFGKDGKLSKEAYKTDSEYGESAIVPHEAYYEIPMRIAFEMYKNISLSSDEDKISLSSDKSQSLKCRLTDDVLTEIFADMPDKRDTVIPHFIGAMYYRRTEEDGTTVVEFVHKTLYEYFLAQYFLWVIADTPFSDKAEEQQAYLKKVCETFCYRHYSPAEMADSSRIMTFYQYTAEKQYDGTALGQTMADRIAYVDKQGDGCAELCSMNPDTLLIKKINYVHINYWNFAYVLTSEDWRKNISEAISNNICCYDDVHIILSGADLREAKLFRTNLFSANLSEAKLSEAKLLRADLSWANLSGANLSGAKLLGANLSVAELTDTIFDQYNITEAEKYYSAQELNDFDIRVFIDTEHDTFNKSKYIPYSEFNTAKYRREDEIHT